MTPLLRHGPLVLSTFVYPREIMGFLSFYAVFHNNLQIIGFCIKSEWSAAPHPPPRTSWKSWVGHWFMAGLQGEHTQKLNIIRNGLIFDSYHEVSRVSVLSSLFVQCSSSNSNKSSFHGSTCIFNSRSGKSSSKSSIYSTPLSSWS